MPEAKYKFWQRARMAVNFILNKPILTESKKTPYVNVGNYSFYPQRSLVDYETYYREGYSENSLIYSAITYKAKSITQAKLTAYEYIDEKDNYKPLGREHDLQRLLDKPNQYQSGDAFQSLQNIFFNLTGNAFTYLERSKGQVVKLWPLNPAWVYIIPDKNGEILGYEYKPIYTGDNPIPIEPQNMAHWKLPNPNDPLSGLGFGMSPIMALSSYADVDNMITRFLNIFFKNGSMPTGILKFKDIPLDDKEIENIRSKWKEIYGGYGNWSDIGILDQYGEYQRIGLTFQEMDFSNLDKRSETRILSALGVPLELLPSISGLTGSTYNNKAEARAMFWQDTMMYEMEVVEQEIGRFVNDEQQKIFVQWDKSNVWALKGDVEKQVKSALTLYQMNMPPKIAFKTVGLEVEDYEGIDEAKPKPVLNQSFGDNKPNGKKPSNSDDSNSQDVNNPNNDENAKNLANFETKTLSSFTIEKKKEIYDSFDKMIVSHEPEFLQAAKNLFSDDEKEILSIINKVKTKSLEQKASLQWLDAIDDTYKYLNGFSKEQWRKTYSPLIQGVYEDTGSYWGLQLGLEFDIRNIQGELALDEYTLVFSNQIAQTNSDNIKAILQTGYKEGYTIEQMTSSINDLYSGWSEWRGELISRTETTRAANDGARKLYQSWGIEKKEWLSTNDDRTRDSHLAMNEQIVDIDKPFKTPDGIELMQPGDSNAPLSETAACRCTVLPVLN